MRKKLKMKLKMTKRNKLIAASMFPNIEHNASGEEIREAKLLARGKYWRLDDCSFVAFSPSGRRQYFDCDPVFAKGLVKFARLWAKGKTREANKLYNEFSNGAF